MLQGASSLRPVACPLQCCKWACSVDWVLTCLSSGLPQNEPLRTPSNSIASLGAAPLTSQWLQQSMQSSTVLPVDKDRLSPRLVKADPRASLDTGRQALSLLGRMRPAPSQTAGPASSQTAGPAGWATASELLTQCSSVR